jgi:uncharacterized repeat protein (TIGR03803 family)
VLHRFCPQGRKTCADGVLPVTGTIPPGASLTLDAAGNLYGTTPWGGGAHSLGVVYEWTPADTGRHETILYRFAGAPPDYPNGAQPLAGLIMDTAGNLYGTTFEGGANEASGRGGTVFELSPDQTRTAWTETTLYNFCMQSGCADGTSPIGGLIGDAAGNLYGTTGGGGANGEGTVFELTPDKTGTTWSETVLYSFCVECIDGQNPQAALIMDGVGNLYGTTYGGGAKGGGTVFELSPDKTGTIWTETVLYGFPCPTNGCIDGTADPSGLIMDGAGNLYGTTVEGGAYKEGTVFELSPDKPRTAWTEMDLYSFGKAGDSSGYWPVGGVIMDNAGNLYGTTSDDGSGGAVFELSPGADGWRETVVYVFRRAVDGVSPNAGLIMDEDGNLYGTTEGGGINERGVVFELARSR